MPPAKSQVTPTSSPGRHPSKAPPEVVDPIWLLKALAVSVVAALICGYASLCFLFYQGRWQMVLHPSRIVNLTPASAGLAYSDVHFDAAATGQPRLTAWWLPAGPDAGLESRYAAYTVLYLHDSKGSLSDTVPALARLHAVGVNVFAIDYRAYGASDATVQPSQDRMSEDAAAALAYLTSTRHIPSRSIVPYGVGLGAALAASLALSHPEVPAVVLDNPDPDPASTAAANHPSRIVPVRLLFGDGFNVQDPIARLTIPKLMIAGGSNLTQLPDGVARLQILFKRAASPGLSVTLPLLDSEGQYRATLTRFIDQYLPGK